MTATVNGKPYSSGRWSDLYSGHDGRTHLAVDQPSTTFGSFASPNITAVGTMLDQRLVDLLRHLGVVQVAVDS